MRKFLIGAIVVVSVILVGMLGFIWFDSTHFYVDGQAYAYYARSLDLREEEISVAHYQAVRSQLPDCEILWNVPLSSGGVSSDSSEISLTSLTEGDVELIAAYFPGLQRVSAAGCSDYELLKLLEEVLTDCEVAYQVDLGGAFADPGAKELSLAAGSFDFAVLLENLVHISGLEQISFPKCELSREQMEQLRLAYPEISVTGTVELLGKEYDTQTVALDLSAMTSAEVSAAADRLGMLAALETVELMDASGTSKLTMADVKLLQDAAPNALFHYEFDFYGHSVSTLDEEVIIKYIEVEDPALEENLRQALSVMENCRRFVLEAKGPYDKIWKSISCETLAVLREEFRDNVKLVWRVYFGENGSSLTDAEVIRAVYGLVDDNSKDLIYCENVRYLDLGHNDLLDYMDFLSGMTELECAILSGAPLKDLSPIAACKNLKFLEIANCIYLPDINALAECTQLEMLNISYTRFEDISVLEELELTHLTAVVSRVEDEVFEQYALDHPDCWVVYEGEQPYGEGWRYDDKGDPLEWYSRMIEAFHYPNAYNNIGWYLPDDEE